MLSNAAKSVQCIMQLSCVQELNPATRVLQCCQFYEVKYTAAPRFKRAITQNASLAKVVMQMMKKSGKVTTHCTVCGHLGLPILSHMVSICKSIVKHFASDIVITMIILADDSDQITVTCES